MTLHELDSAESLETFKSSNTNSLICFSATWCGPCKKSKPELVELAQSYTADPTIDLSVGIVYEHTLGDAISTYTVTCFPTYVLFGSNGSMEHGRVEGVRFDEIRKMVATAGCKKSLGMGHALGGGGDGGTAGGTESVEQARARRLARFGAAPEPRVKPAAPAAPDVVAPTAAKVEVPPDVEMEDAEDVADAKLPATEGAVVEDVAMVDPTEALSAEDIATLTTVMGFSTVRAQKGLINSTSGVEGAVEWLLEHQEDDDIDEPVSAAPALSQKAQSYRCNQCQKTLSNMANLELHANKTGHSDFEESTVAVKPLTPEEKEAKIAEIKQLLKKKRAERVEVEKAENIDREKQRRFMGKEMTATKTEMDREKRKRDAYLRKKEKDSSKNERARIRREIEKDKLERRANKGKMPSKIGVDGYNPDAIQYDVKGDGDEGDSDGAEKAKTAKQPASKPKVSIARIDEYISKVASYRAGGDGGKCLKILLAYVKNIVDHPTETKYQSINVENKAYRTKVKPFIGAKSFLLAIGFAPNENGNALVLNGDNNADAVGMEILAQARVKLEAAYAAY